MGCKSRRKWERLWGGCGQRGPALPRCAPWLTGPPHLEFIASRRRKEEERRAGRAGSGGGRRRLCPPLSCPGSPTPGHRPSPASSFQNHPLAVPARRRQGHSGQGRDPGRPSQVSVRGKGEVRIWAGRRPLRPWDPSLGAQPGVKRHTGIAHAATVSPAPRGPVTHRAPLSTAPGSFPPTQWRTPRPSSPPSSGQEVGAEEKGGI